MQETIFENKNYGLLGFSKGLCSPSPTVYHEIALILLVQINLFLWGKKKTLISTTFTTIKTILYFCQLGEHFCLHFECITSWNILK